MSDDLTDLVKALQARAVEVRQSKRHLLVRQEGQLIASLPVSPGEYRGLTNARLQLERAGALEKVRQQTGSKRGRRAEAPQKPYEGPLYPSGRQPRPRGSQRPSGPENDGGMP